MQKGIKIYIFLHHFHDREMKGNCGTDAAKTRIASEIGPCRPGQAFESMQ